MPHIVKSWQWTQGFSSAIQIITAVREQIAVSAALKEYQVKWKKEKKEKKNTENNREN